MARHLLCCFEEKQISSFNANPVTWSQENGASNRIQGDSGSFLPDTNATADVFTRVLRIAEGRYCPVYDMLK